TTIRWARARWATARRPWLTLSLCGFADSRGCAYEELMAYIRNTTTTYHHQVGTCAMGDGEEAVVDPESLRVRGLQGLRV
ncbi:hypothetical protein D9C01_13805, partial [Corynebacterium diphtheriae]